MSDSVINQISLHWSHAFASSIIVSIIIVALVSAIFIYLISKLDANNHFGRSLMCIFGIIITCVIGISYMTYVDDNDINGSSVDEWHYGKVNHEVMDYKPLLHKKYSKKDIPNTAKIINHNEKIIPKEWNHDRKIYNTDVKPYSKYRVTKKFQIYMIHRHRWSNYQHKIFKQKNFDKINRPFITKKYLHNPKWYDYL